MEKLVDEVVKDGEHLTHLIGICEGNLCEFKFILNLFSY